MKPELQTATKLLRKWKTKTGLPNWRSRKNMLKKHIATFLSCTVILLTVAPPQSPAQSLAQSSAGNSQHNLDAALAISKSDLKASLAKEIAKLKAHTLTEADARRIEKERQDPQSGPKAKEGWSRRDKFFLGVFIVGTAALVGLLIAKGKIPKDCDTAHPSDPVTCDILFGNQ